MDNGITVVQELGIILQREDPSLAFAPNKDIVVGQFVALCTIALDRPVGAIFYVAKV